MVVAAREAGCLAELDAACRAAACRGSACPAPCSRVCSAPLTVFVNVEPEVLDDALLAELARSVADAPGDLRVVMEITERALAARPAEVLRTVDRVGEFGWAVALDDVGAESLSLAFMPLLRPDVVKLDLRLVQERPGPAITEIMNAVNAYAETSGALVLAEGIEDAAHLRMARALGATLGHGWLFGRPGAGAAAGQAVGRSALRPPQPVEAGDDEISPFQCLPPTCRCAGQPRRCSSSCPSSWSGRPCAWARPASWPPPAGCGPPCARTDLLSRLGGDEFVVVLHGLDPVTAQVEAGQVVAALRAAVSRPLRVGGGEVSVGVSIGLAVHPDAGDDFDGLLHHADVQMYESKQRVL